MTLWCKTWQCDNCDELSRACHVYPITALISPLLQLYETIQTRLSPMHIDRLYSSIWGFIIHIDQQKKRTWNTSSDAAEGCLTSLVFWYDEDNTEHARLASAGGHYRCMSPSISYPIKMRQWQKWPGCDLDPWWHLHPASALSRLSGHILSNREGGEKTARYS